MAGRLSTPTDFETELQRIPSVKCALVTDLQGVVLLRAGSSTDEAALQQMAATFALTTDQANKLRLGKAKHFTLCYGALTEGERSACARTHTASHLTPLASPVPRDHDGRARRVLSPRADAHLRQARARYRTPLASPNQAARLPHPVVNHMPHAPSLPRSTTPHPCVRVTATATWVPCWTLHPA